MSVANDRANSKNTVHQKMMHGVFAIKKPTTIQPCKRTWLAVKVTQRQELVAMTAKVACGLNWVPLLG